MVRLVDLQVTVISWSKCVYPGSCHRVPAEGTSGKPTIKSIAIIDISLGSVHIGS